MNRSPHQPADRRLRLRFALAAAILVLAASASALMLVILGARVSSRIDLTATREHRLAPRSQAVLDALDRPVRLILAADFSAIDRGLRQRTLDVIDTFRAASARRGMFSATVIDTSSPAGLAEYDALLGTLAEESRAAIDAQRSATEGVIAAARDAAARMADTAASLQAIRDLMPAGESSADTLRRFFDDQAAVGRAFDQSLRAAADRAADALAQPPEGLPVPPLDGIARLLRGEMARLAGDLPGLNSSLDRFARTVGVPADAATRAAALSSAIASLRDTLARRVLEIDAMKPLPIVTVARTIQRTRAALLVAEPSDDAQPGHRDLAAIDPDVLLPTVPILPAGASAPPSLDTRARTEELIAAGLASFTRAARPVVVFVHAGERRIGPSFAPWWGNVAARLNVKGIDAAEWAVVLDEHPPVITPAKQGDPATPVAFVVVGLEVRRAEDAGRFAKLSAAVARLIREGRSVLLSASPSTLPSGGAADPMVEPLDALGLKADTGLLLMEETRSVSSSGAVRLVAPDFSIVDPGSDHPIASAVAGLNTYLPWAVPLRAIAEPPRGVTIEPILTIPSRAGTWAESEWLTFWQAPADQRARVPQPMNDSPRDRAAPGSGDRWWVAAAIERRDESLPRAQRLVVVGSPAWFFDMIADAQTAVDGRVSLAAPGNVELLAASIAWLAGREDLIARSAEAAAIPTLPTIDPARLAGMRWALIAGLPAVVLLVGAVWRLWRG